MMNNKLNNKDFNDGLLNFLNNSPTPFHAVKTIIEVLNQAGYKQLNEADEWKLEKTGKYYVSRNDSSIVAFALNSEDVASDGFKMVGAHTDSPCLKVKPSPEISTKNYFQLGVEVYGGALLNPWFDRDLSLAGRISYQTKAGNIESLLHDFKKPIAIIPSLAIHLDRQANENRTINKQKELPPILLCGENSNEINFHDLLMTAIHAQHEDLAIEQILDYELFFYDTQPASLVGYQDDFVSSARLDNLLSCYTGLMALLETGEECNALMVCNDHEEVGSASSSGAQGPFLRSVIERIAVTQESFTRCMHNSVMISADNAHGVHPNYVDKHDGNHGPILNQGPVIKINANQRYATNSETSAMFRLICQNVNVPVQSFVVRSDMACGSTIGPITASELGVKTIDIGVPTFAMHSIRELAGSGDAYSLYKALAYYFSKFSQ